MQFKTSVLCTAVALSLAAVTASASDIRLYGAVDTGFTYTHGYNSDVNTLEMSTGNYAGSRWGVKGSEDLGNGAKVNFILESGFKSDTGELGKAGSLFNRESQINISSAYGTIGFGRVGAFSSGSSSLSWYWDLEPFETGYMDAGIQASQVNAWRLNSNTIYYVSPQFAGFKLGAQYSLTGTNDKEAEKYSQNNTFGNIALRYDGISLRGIAALEWERFGQPAAGAVERQDDAFNLKVAGAYNPNQGPWTFYGGFSWYKNYSEFSDSAYVSDITSKAYFGGERQRLQAWSAFVGTKYVIGQADLLASIQYLDGKNKNPVTDSEFDNDYSRLVGAVGLHYHFSNRTMLYAIASHADGHGALDKAANNRFMAHLGLTHFF